jgi:large subunit ribosomal protein L10
MAVDVSPERQVPEWKIKEVDELAKRLNESKVLGIVGIRDIPARQLQLIRGDLRGKAEILVVQNNIARRAIDKCSGGIKSLTDYVEDQTAFIFAEANSFDLYKILEAEKRPMPIRGGGVAPRDIIIEAGETSFSPGPVVGNLQTAGIPAAIKRGKVVINETKLVAKEGDVVSPKLAEMLALMEIYPRDVGLDLRALHEDGLIFRPEDLAIDIEGIISSISMSAQQALSFAIEIGYPAPSTIAALLSGANTKARNLVVGSAIPVPSMMEQLLSDAVAKANVLAGILGSKEIVAEEISGTQVKAKVIDEEVPEEPEEEEEEDTAAGLGSLFG